MKHFLMGLVCVFVFLIWTILNVAHHSDEESEAMREQEESNDVL